MGLPSEQAEDGREDLFFLRPITGERIPAGRVKGKNPLERLYGDEPKIGLAISTFGSPAYVELGLAVRDRLYPGLPTLVHDDASDREAELAEVCRRRGATFETNSRRLGHAHGDVASFVAGLRWGKEQGLDLVVKMSRRFVPLADWVNDLRAAAVQTQYGTFGRPCRSYNFPLRTECMAMSVALWNRPEVMESLEELAFGNLRALLVEQEIMRPAAMVYEAQCQAAWDWEARHVRGLPKPMFVEWGLLSPGRTQKGTTHLWHETSPPAEYADIARQVGLDFGPERFTDPEVGTAGRL